MAAKAKKEAEAEAKEDAATFLGCARAPWAFVECGFGRGYGTVDVIGARVGDLGDDFFGGGIDHREDFAAARVNKFAVDVHLIFAHACF